LSSAAICLAELKVIGLQDVVEDDTVTVCVAPGLRMSVAYSSDLRTSAASSSFGTIEVEVIGLEVAIGTLQTGYPYAQDLKD
jgi:hypothetical protein